MTYFDVAFRKKKNNIYYYSLFFGNSDKIIKVLLQVNKSHETI